MSEFDKSMPVMPDEPASSQEKSQLISTSSIHIKFSQDIIGVEIANDSNNATIYLDISGGTAALNKGIPIYPKGYYAADKKVQQHVGISLISTHSNTDVRIIGHYNLESENV